jgi:hypothetical protein
MATFRILDQLSSLRTAESRRQPAAFRELLIPTTSTDPIGEGLTAYSGAVADHLRELLRTTRAALRDEVISGIYVPGVHDIATGKITLSDGTTLLPEQYVTGVVRELRNTYHGYHTHQFERYLLINTGSTPESLPAIAVLAYLALIARPDLFLTRTWES